LKIETDTTAKRMSTDEKDGGLQYKKIDGAGPERKKQG
jgi:hypothetical protein